jgi:hypothetical protein
LGALVPRNEIRGDDAADAKESPVTESGQHPSCKEEIVRRGDRAGEIAESEDTHQEKEREFALEPCGSDCNNRGADGNRERVASDENPGFWDADLEVGGEVGQEPHNDEFGRTNAKGRDGKSHQRCVQQDIFALGNNFGACFKGGHLVIATYLLSRMKNSPFRCRGWAIQVLGSIGLCWNFLHRSSL